MERKKLVLGIQHLFAMFGATVLVPTLTGMNAGVALIGAGVGTLLFHFVTGGKVPVFLGSSFAFIGAILAAKEVGGIPAAQGGIIVAGFIYLILSVLAKVVGPEKIKDFFPPVVTGPVVMVIGLSLAPVAINWAKENW
jgi:uracil permease